MSLSTSMMTDPFMMYAMQKQKITDYTDQQYKNSMDFGQVLSGVHAENTAVLKKTGVSAGSGTDQISKTEAYTQYLKSKYGNLTIKSVGKDQKTLDGLGKSMSGSDVIIAPNIVEQMANDPDKAAYYERKIDAFFEDIPRQTALFAAGGLDYQPCGVVVHEDGSVTYISGCADSPERVAQVNAINKEKREKQAAARKAALEHSQEAAAWQRELMERYLTRKAFSVSMITDFDGTGGNLL